MNNILIGIDFNENAEKIIAKATEIARCFQSKIWLLHVAAPDPDFVGYEPGPQHERDIRANVLKNEHEKLTRYADQLQIDGFDAEALLVQGTTIETILDTAKKLKADMIVTGHRDMGFWEKLFFGDTATHLVKKAEMPILIVP